MKTDFPTVEMFNQRSILIQFPGDIDEKTLDNLLNLKVQILERSIKVKLEVIHSYTSLLVIYPYTIKDFYSEKEWLNTVLNSVKVGRFSQAQEFLVPVCYHPSVAPDLSLISKEKGLSEKEVIELHTAETYRVYLIGFLPGFLYLGGLNKRLEMPRKKQPRLNISAGSVGIGGLQTGIYPGESPGGWQIIGRCPMLIFNPNVDPPVQIKPGDLVRFYSISLEQFKKIEATESDLRNSNLKST